MTSLKILKSMPQALKEILETSSVLSSSFIVYGKVLSPNAYMEVDSTHLNM